MSDYTISRIFKSDLHGSRQMDLLLLQEGIRRDPNLDYSCGLFDDKMQLVATGSCFGNTLRCLAVSRLHQGEGLMNRIVTTHRGTVFPRQHPFISIYKMLRRQILPRSGIL